MRGTDVVLKQDPESVFEHPRFEVVRVLGSGGLGHVYEVIDRERSARVALKTLRKVNAETVLLLKREFRAVQELNHPSLVRLGELHEHQGLFFFTMELIQGHDFVQHVRSRSTGDHQAPSCDFDRLRSCTVQAAQALDALHRVGKLHLDVKPSNMLVEANGRVVLLDFGMAADWRNNQRNSTGPLGTIPYMAPEQVSGEELSPATDLYALGATIYQCLTGRVPFEGDDHDVMEAKLLREPEPPSLHAADVPPELETLCLRLLSTEASERPNTDELLTLLGCDVEQRHSVAGSGDDEVFVGREVELATLASAFDDSKATAVTVMVRGQSGVGKTQLVRHFVDALCAEPNAPRVLWGKCFEREQLLYKGVDAVIDGLFDVLNALSEAERGMCLPSDAGLLARAFPVLAGLIVADATEDAQLVPTERRRRTFAAFRSTIDKLTRRRPLVIVIDDIQWADADSLALLRAVLEPPDAPPMLLLLLERWSASDGATLALPGDVRSFELSLLSASETEQLARGLLARQGDQIDAASLARISHETHGHPLFITELTRQRRGADVGVMGLDDMILARVRALGVFDQAVLGVVATAGYPVELDVLARSVAASAGSLFDALVRLRNEKLVRSDRDEHTVCAYHDRLRISVAEQLGEAARVEVHRSLAVAMEALGRNDSEALARHWEGAHENNRSAHYVRLAIDKALAALAFSRAATLIEKLLSLQPLDDEQRTQLELRLADAWDNAGYGVKSARVRLSLAERVGAEQAVEQRRLAAGNLLTSGHFDEGAALLRRVVVDSGLFFPETPGRALVGLLARRFQLNVRGLRFKRCDPERTDPRRRVLVDASWSASSGMLMNDVIRGNYYLAVHVLEALKLGEPERIVRGLAIEALAGGAANHARSRQLLDRAHEIARELDTPHAHAMVASGEGGLGYFWGEHTTAIPQLLRAETLFRDHCTGVRYQISQVSFMLCRVLNQCGAIRELSARLPGYVRDAEERGDLYLLVNLRSTPQVLVSLAHDDPDDANAQLVDCERHLTREGFHVQHYLTLSGRVQVALYQGDSARAYALLKDSWDVFARSLLMRVPLIRIHAYDMLARAALAIAAQDKARWPELRKEVVRCHKKLAAEHDAWVEVPRDMLRGSVSLFDGDSQTAVEHFRRAHTASAARGMKLHAAALASTLGKLVQGDEGAQLTASGLRGMRDEGVVQPAKLCTLLTSHLADSRR